MKDNATHCNIKVIELSPYVGVFQTLLVIKEFKDPLADEPSKKKDLSQNSYYSLEQSQGGCGDPEPYDYYSNHIRYLMIRDVKVHPSSKDVIVATDYQHGLFFWRIVNCTHDIRYECQSEPLYRVRRQQAGSMSVLSLDTPDGGENVIFVSQVNPPRIAEIIIEMVENPPIVGRIYRLGGAVENEYHSMDMIDANENFILSQLIHIRSMKPLLRVYRRKTDLFSSVYTEIPLNEFLDTGLYFQFIDIHTNSFVIRSSKSYMIYRIQPTYLQIDVWGQSTAQILGLKSNPSMEARLNLTMTIKNQTFHKLMKSIEIVILDENNSQTLSLIEGSKQDPIQLKYMCGEEEVIPSGVIMDNFRGKKNRLTIENNSYFELKIPRVEYQRSWDYRLDECQVNALVKFKGPTNNQKSNYFVACSQKRGSEIKFFNQFTNSSYPVPSFKLDQSNIRKIYFDYRKEKLLMINDNAGKSSKKTGFNLQFFDTFNILAWDATINFNNFNLTKYMPPSTEFTLRANDPMSFNSKKRQGILFSETYSVRKGVLGQSFIIFEVFDGLKALDVFQIRVVQNFEFEDNSNKTGKPLNEQVVIKQSKIDSNGFIWHLLANSTLIIYQQIEPLSQIQDKDGEAPVERYFNIHQIKEYQRIDLVNSSQIYDRENGVINFDIEKELLIIYSGVNTIAMHELELQSLEILKSMVLPVQYSNGDYEDANVELHFVISNETKMAIYQNMGEYLFVLFEVQVKGFRRGYQIQIYDIKQPRQNSLILRYNVTLKLNEAQDELIIDTQYARIQLFKISADLIGVLLTIDYETQVYYEFQARAQLIVKKEKIDEFNELCKRPDIRFNISLYPSDNPGQYVNFTLIPENKGLLITKGSDSENMTLQVLPTEDTQVLPELRSARFNLMSNFQGHNMVYNYSCTQQRVKRQSDWLFESEDYENTEEMCDDIQLQRQVIERNFSIDFLSKNNPSKGFFVVEPFLLFFDTKNAHIFNPSNSQYYSTIDILEVFPYLAEFYKMVHPVIENYMLFDIEFHGQEGKAESRKYLVTMTDIYQVSISRVIAVTTEEDQKKYAHLEGTRFSYQFDANNDLKSREDRYLFVQYAYNYSITQAKIHLMELYALDINEYDNLGAVMVYDKPEIADMSSTIEVYQFDLRSDTLDAMNVSISRNLTFRAIYAEKLGVSYFKVTAIAIMQQKKVLVIALKDVGLLFYSMDHQEVIKLEQLPSRLSRIGTFFINRIFPQTDNQFVLFTKQRGVIIVTYPGAKKNVDDDDDYQVYRSEEEDQLPIVLEEEPALSLVEDEEMEERLSSYGEKRLVAYGKYAIAFTELNLQSITQTSQKGYINLRFYGFTVANKSRSLGSYQLAFADSRCSSLQEIRDPSFLRFSNVTESTMFMAIVCDSTLKIVAYNLYPSLEITLQDQYQMEVSQSTIEITSSNSLSNQTINLQLTLVNQERSLNTIIFMLFLLCLALTVFVLQFVSSRQPQKTQETVQETSKQIKKKQQQQYVKFKEEDDSSLDNGQEEKEEERKSKSVNNRESSGSANRSMNLSKKLTLEEAVIEKQRNNSLKRKNSSSSQSQTSTAFVIN